MLSDIIHRVAVKSGLQEDTDREFMVQLINDAGREIYNQEDLPGVLKEVAIGVQSRSYVSLPNFVGTIKAIREANSQEKIVLTDLRPKYASGNWSLEWFNWRVIGHRALAINIGDATRLTVTAKQPESTAINYTITGSTIYADRKTEVVADGVQTDGIYNSIDSIRRETKADYNAEVTNEDGDILAELPNYAYGSEYLHVDVSSYPWKTTADACAIELLYKPPYFPMEFDSDSFVIPDLEDAVYYMALALWYLTQKDGEAYASNFANRSTSVIGKYRYLQEGPVEKKISFNPRGTYSMFGGRWRSYPAYPKY